jgi:hypothetical protein
MLWWGISKAVDEGLYRLCNEHGYEDGRARVTGKIDMQKHDRN